MKVLRDNMRSFCIFMAVLMLLVSVPRQSVLAALIDTEKVLDSAHGQEARDQIRQFLAREEIQAALIANGIDPVEAERRVDALSDEEAMRIADEIEKLPAGGGVLEFLLITLLVLIIVFVILDLTGVTDVFTFIKSPKSK